MSEVEERLAAAKKHDTDKLVAKRLAALGIRAAPVQTPARPKLDRSVEGFDASGYPVTPPTKETFVTASRRRAMKELGRVTFSPATTSGGGLPRGTS